MFYLFSVSPPPKNPQHPTYIIYLHLSPTQQDLNFKNMSLPAGTYLLSNLIYSPLNFNFKCPLLLVSC